MDDPWYADPTSCDTSKVKVAEPEPGLSTANLPGPNDVEHRKRVAHISKLPSGKHRVDQVLTYVHDTDPRAFNDFLMELSIQEQDELTQGLLKIRKKKADKNNENDKDLTQTWFLKIPEDERSAVSIIGWWETRRVLYNAIVGAVGLLSIGIILVGNLTHIAPHDLLITLITGAIAYGIAANICYTGGWMAELSARQLFREKAEFFGPIALMLGTVFSVVLTLAPAAVLVLIWLLRFFGMGVV